MTTFKAADLTTADDPQWTQATKVHDWRNHVGEETRRIWPTLTAEQRRAIAADADEMAGREEWE